ncbi:MAG: hypothetical protein ACM3SP_15020, partial [Chloroflexota bacterium]
SNCDAQPRPRFQDPHPGGLQRKIPLIRKPDQPDQYGIIEHRPPFPMVRGRGVQGFVVLRKPFIRHQRRRGFEIWTEQTSLSE